MKKTSKINANRLTALRRGKFSQKELAAKVGCHPRTVSRWELGEIDRLRQDKLGKLCAALNATEEDLCGEGELPITRGAQVEAQKGQMNLNIDSACRNALALVAHRYGVTRQQVVEAAPLLFFIAAEQSLQERQKRLLELQEAAETLINSQISHLPPKMPIDENALASEQQSIKAHDLFGTIVAEQIGTPVNEDWNDREQNPFAVFLRDTLFEVLGSKGSQSLSWAPGWSPQYKICEEEASKIVDHDPKATSAILDGLATLHDMPPQVRKGSAADRAAWARAESDRAHLEFDHLLRAIEGRKL
jgi:transcriptional regulator with XRE-family HTH domain